VGKSKHQVKSQQHRAADGAQDLILRGWVMAINLPVSQGEVSGSNVGGTS
jgi:hypothetical protein